MYVKSGSTGHTFKGVYPKTYIKHDNVPKKTHLKLIVDKIITPHSPKLKEKRNAFVMEILLVGSGRFLVLSIRLSTFTS